MLSLTDSDKSDLQKIFRRLRARAVSGAATPEAFNALRSEITSAFDRVVIAGETAEQPMPPDADAIVKHFNDERDSRPSPFAPAK